jgi:iron complex outermembrane receptor protein
VSAYYIDWKDIQLSITNAQNINYNANAGQAKSQGLELSVQAHPTQGLTISAWTAWNDAELTEALAASTGFGPAGSRLPFSSRFSGSLSLNQEFPLTANWTGFAGGSVSYVGSRAGNFVPTAVPPAPQVDRELFPAYAKLDLRVGTKYGSWSGNLYANNVADRRGSLNGNPAIGTVIYIQPRTVGLFVAKDF